MTPLLEMTRMAADIMDSNGEEVLHCRVVVPLMGVVLSLVVHLAQSEEATAYEGCCLPAA